jgi:hypothetical protein
MGVRTYDAAPATPRRAVGPGVLAIVGTGVLAFVPLVANGRPIGDSAASGLPAWIERGLLALLGPALPASVAGPALAGKALAALFAAVAAGAVFAAVAERHPLGSARTAGLLLAFATTLAAAAQSWSGEAPATAAVAVALWLLCRAEPDDGRGAALCGLPLGLALAFQPSTVGLVFVVVAILTLYRGRTGLLATAWALPGGALALLQAPSPPTLPRPSDVLALVASPAKGALVFAPVALVGVVGILRALLPRRRSRLWDQPAPGRLLPSIALLGLVAHFVSVALTGGWSSGIAWGPRLVAPAWPLMALFLPEGLALLGVAGLLVAAASVAIQALGAITYDGRWDQLHRGKDGGLGPAVWNLPQSPIPFQVRERVLRYSLPTLAGGRLAVRERAVSMAGRSGSYVTFGRGELSATGADVTMVDFRLEGGARVVGPRLELAAVGDGLAFEVREGARQRRLEIRIKGSGRGTIGVGTGRGVGEPRFDDRAVSGSFSIRRAYFFPDSAGPDVVLRLRAGGPISLQSVALVPPTEPEEVLRLP